jgi:hypothetical protein
VPFRIIEDCTICFVISPHIANVERVFSLLQAEWTKERNKLTAESVEGILFVQYNFKETSSKNFHTYLKSNKSLLKEMQSAGNLKWAQEKENEGNKGSGD